MTRKYSGVCCDKASVAVDPLKLHCAFCGVHLCDDHAEDAEVEGHVFTTCANCHTTFKTRRPGKHEHCTCHDEEYCDHHDNVGDLG